MDQRKRRIHDASNTKCKRALTEKVNLLDNLHHPIVKVTKLPCPFCTIQAIKIATAPFGVNQRKSGFQDNLTAQDRILPCSAISIGIVGLSKNSSPWTGLGCVDTKPLQRDRASLGSAHVPPAQIRAWQQRIA